MKQQAEGSYNDYRVLTAGPAARVRMLYEKAITHIESAQAALREGDAEGRGRNVTGAHAILGELIVSLNREVAPELSHRLETFYEYLQWRLLEGHSKRDAGAFEEARSLLGSMKEAWVDEPATEVKPDGPAPAPVEVEPVGEAPQGAHPYLRQGALGRSQGRLYL
jgi:flagellar biosynthetic protein FliS